ncbi:class I SAM-dependent methyltransferase [Streptosporangiaceae bacterium NEAU-GS5]|nr:class I SAM-dependent methyltransferase [Streptosporangiaceae bacterium NEAU-GS5]
MTTLTREVAHEWIVRWDRQQEGYLPDREDRFTTLIDAVEAGAGRPDPLVLDLGCGPGSLAARLLDRLPDAQVIAVDTDPLLLALGKAEYGDRPGLRFTDQDLRASGWTAGLGVDRPVDAVVSTTALHWIAAPDLEILYAELAAVLRSGGLYLNGDHLTSQDTTPRLGELEQAIAERATARRYATARPEDWRQWWDAVAADPALTELHADRERLNASRGHHGSESAQLSIHVAALAKAEFGEIGTLWQHGNDRLLCAVR